MEWETKLYSAWGGSHLAIQAADDLQARYHVNPQDIEKVVIAGFSTMFMGHEMRKPESIMAAQYSLPFTTALAFFKDLRDPTVWKEEVLRDRAVAALVDKIQWHVDDEFESIHKRTYGYGGVRLTATLNGGRELSTTLYHRKGSVANPLTPEEIHHKFRSLAGYVIPPGHAEQIARTVDSLEKVNDLRRLGELL